MILCASKSSSSRTTPTSPNSSPCTSTSQFGRSSPSGGTGLGLAIAQKIAEAHDGKIDVESVIGSGTTFDVALATHG
ncbi:MAG: hypothetical protein CME20_01120 [Gemmatimonadetes bacterium]|nr:hypothetical protein [Gemmatimonadota bacterium]